MRLLQPGGMLIIMLLCIAVAHAAQQDTVVRVGVYQNAPLIFMDDNGEPKGIFADLLKHIAASEGWRLEYTAAPFNQLMQGLQQKTIDILPVVAYSAVRAKTIDFNRENILTNWGQVYTPQDSTIIDIADLQGKKIAALKQDIHYQIFRQLIASFGIQCEIVEVDDYHQVLQKVADQTVDAGVVNRLFGQENGGRYGLVKNGIIFNPIKIHFAFPLHDRPDLVASIDRQLRQLKQQPDSVYYQTIERWLGEKFPTQSFIARFMATLLGLILAGYLLLLALQLQPLRRALGMTEVIEQGVIFNVLAVSVVLALSAWGLITIIDYLWFNNAGNSLLSLVFPMTDEGRMFYRVVLVGGILFSGFIVSAMFSRRLREQRRIQLSEQRFRLTTKAGKSGVWDWDLSSNELYVAPFLKHMLGYDDDEIDNNMDAWIRHVHADDRERIREAVDDSMQDAHSEFHVEHRMMHKNGDIRWMLAHGSVIRDETGHALRMVGTDTDITELKNAQQSLQASEQRFRSLFEGAEVSVWDEDVSEVYRLLDELRATGVSDLRQYCADHPDYPQMLAGKIRVNHVNRTTLRLFNAQDEGEFIDQISNSFGPGALDIFIDSLCAYWNGERAFRSEANYRTLQGEPLQCIVSFAIPTDASGYHHVPITIIDITERKMALKAVVENQVLLKEAQSMAHIGNWELDAKTLKAVWSEEIFDMLGIDMTDDVGPATLEKLLHPDDRVRVLDSLMAAINDECPHHMEYRVIRPDGAQRWIECRALPSYAATGEVVRLKGVVQDITERKLNEQTLVTLKEQAERSESKFKAITEQATEGITVADMDGNYTFVNKAFCDMIGYSEPELLRMTVFDVKAPEQDKSSFDRTKGADEGTEVAVYLQRKDGSVFIASVIGKVIEFGGLTQVLGTIRDITRQVKADQMIRTLSLAVEQSPVSVMLTDTDANIEYVNAAFENITGYKAADVHGLNPRFLRSPNTPSSVYRQMWQALNKGENWQGEIQNCKKNGEVFWEYAHFVPVIDEYGTTRHYLAVKEDITLRKQQEEHIIHQAHYDTLTNLPNRFLSLDRLSQLMEEAKRDETQVAVMFLDLDDFKKVNDSLGHETGDKLLVEAAERLGRVLRSGDTVGRFGGDEFIVLLGRLNEAADARPVAENLLNRFREAFRIDDRELMITLSVGIAIYPNDADNTSDLLRNADSAMYHSKQLGRNTYCFFTDEMNRNASHRLALEEQMHGALDRDEFYVCYQPKVDVDSGRIIGAEALLRWHNPALGEVSPAEFIPIAEHTGLIIHLGKFVLSRALSRVAAWQREYRADFNIAINLSPRQFRDPGLVEYIESSLQRYTVGENCVELEITEGVLMSGYSYVDDAIEGLNRLGVSIAMDDFGTGYSSLNYLRSYPFDVLKIDKSFVRDISVDQADRELINATIAMAHGLNLQVVAEGVETEQQYQFLKQRGCDCVQGYLFGKPMRAEDFDKLLQTAGTEYWLSQLVEV